MSASIISQAVTRSYNLMRTAYTIATTVTNPHPIRVLQFVALVLVGGTLASIGAIAMNLPSYPLTATPQRLIAIGSLYALDLIALFTMARMLKTARAELPTDPDA